MNVRNVPETDQGADRPRDPAELRLRDYKPKSQIILPEHLIGSSRFPAVDAHTHLGKWLSAWADMDGQWLVDRVEPWLAEMATYGVRAFLNLDGRWGDELRANLEHFDHAFPGRFATFAHLDWTIFQTDPPRATEFLVRQVHAAHSVGAAGFKVWKDLGLVFRDSADRLISPDDPRLVDVWSAIGETGLPVWWHIGDPTAFFDPVDEQNEHLEMLCEAPEWSFHGKDFPTFGRLMSAFENVVRDHCDVVFTGVHGGCYAENLPWVDRMLTEYPNFHIDIAARLSQLGRQPRATRALIFRHPTRVMFGTDQIPPIGSAYPVYFRFLETSDECFHHSEDPADLSMGRWPISALDLSDDVLRAVYADNVTRLVPQLKITSA